MPVNCGAESSNCIGVAAPPRRNAPPADAVNTVVPDRDVGFTAPRDLEDANYTHSLPISPDGPLNMVLARYQKALPRVAGHTLTNSTSIDLPKHWFGPNTRTA